MTESERLLALARLHDIAERLYRGERVHVTEPIVIPPFRRGECFTIQGRGWDAGIFHGPTTAEESAS